MNRGLRQAERPKFWIGVTIFLWPIQKVRQKGGIMANVLLLGAGFSKNWGAPLAAEVFHSLIADREVRAAPGIRDLSFQHQRIGGFEGALGAHARCRGCVCPYPGPCQGPAVWTSRTCIKKPTFNSSGRRPCRVRIMSQIENEPEAHGIYSCRSASIGSMRAALRAGK